MAVEMADAQEAGRACPYCRFPLRSGVVAQRCKLCGALHHEDCWSDGGGCAVLGCTNREAPAATESSSVDAKKPLPDPTVNVAGSQRSWMPVIAALLALLLVAAIGIAVILVTRDPAAPVVPATARQNDSFESSDEPAAPHENESEELTARKVIRVIRSYESAINRHDPGALSELFAYDVERVGATDGSCQLRSGRSAVAEAYSANFDPSNSNTYLYSYTFPDLSYEEVDVRSAELASLTTRFNANEGSGNQGEIRFVLARDGGGEWQISKIKSCTLET